MLLDSPFESRAKDARDPNGINRWRPRLFRR
jgi:hypothetical protein